MGSRWDAEQHWNVIAFGSITIAREPARHDAEANVRFDLSTVRTRPSARANEARKRYSPDRAGLRPLALPLLPSAVVIRNGSFTSAPVVRSVQTVVNPEDVARVQTDGC